MKDNGLFLLMDIKCTDDPIDNEGPMTAFKFGASLHFCMTTSLANDGEGMGTVGLPKSKVEELCAIVQELRSCMNIHNHTSAFLSNHNCGSIGIA